MRLRKPIITQRTTCNLQQAHGKTYEQVQEKMNDNISIAVDFQFVASWPGREGNMGFSVIVRINFREYFEPIIKLGNTNQSKHVKDF